MSVYHPELTLTKCFSDESSSIPTGFHVSKLQRVKETKQQQQTSNKNQTKIKQNRKKQKKGKYCCFRIGYQYKN